MFSTGKIFTLGKWARQVSATFTYLWVSAFVLIAAPANAESEAPLIAVAANMSQTVEEIAGAFSEQTALRVRLSFGASGNLTRQILQGAPFELFLSADKHYPRMLSDAGLTIDDGVVYAIGRLVLFIGPSSIVDRSVPLHEQIKMLAEEQGYIAVANSETAPYGRATFEVLNRFKLWETLAPRLATAENVAQAAQFIASGSAASGFIPYSYASITAARSGGSYLVIPDDWYSPLRQCMVRLRGASPTALAFYNFVLESAGREIIHRHGYGLP
jgi:molybdate transport system substrate-binding protein